MNDVNRSEYDDDMDDDNNIDGSPIYSIGTVQDILDLKLAKERAEELDRLKSSFLAGDLDDVEEIPKKSTSERIVWC